ARGHQVVLFERELELGGQLTTLRSLPDCGEWQQAIDSFSARMLASGVRVRTSTEANRADVEAASPAVVLCATGAVWDLTGYSPGRPERPRVEGVALPHVIDIASACKRALAEPRSLGGHIVIV